MPRLSKDEWRFKMADIEKLLSRLEKVRGHEPHWRALCPAHENKKTLSLKISQAPDGRVLIHCFAGCGASDVLAAIGLSLKDLFPDTDGRKDWRKEFEKKNKYEHEASNAFAREVRLVHENQMLRNELNALKGGG